MTPVHMRRLLAAVGLVTLSLLILMALILPAANQTLARAGKTVNTPTGLSATDPITIPLVHPVAPIGSSQPAAAQSGGQLPTHTNSINVVPFQPKVHKQLGATPPNIHPSASKPNRPARTPDQVNQQPQPAAIIRPPT